MGAREPACYPRRTPLKMCSRSAIRMTALAVMAFALTGCLKTAGNYFAPTAAIVNGQKIPEAEITRELRNARRLPQFQHLFQGKEAAANRREAERQILNTLIQRVVISQAAARLGITVSTSEVEDQLRRAIAQFPSKKAFSDFLAEQQLTLERARQFIRLDILINKVQLQVGKDAAVPEEQMQAYYDQNKATFDGQIRVAHILVCENYDESNRICSPVPGDQSLAASLAARGRAGEDFAALAREFSKDSTTRDRGGDYGWLGPSQGSAFEEAAFGLKDPGAISDPVQSPSGWHVIKLLNKGRPFEEAKEEIKMLLVRPLQQEEFNKFLRKGLAEAKVRVNPRFGRFDRATLTIVEGEPRRR